MLGDFQHLSVTAIHKALFESRSHAQKFLEDTVFMSLSNGISASAIGRTSSSGVYALGSKELFWFVR